MLACLSDHRLVSVFRLACLSVSACLSDHPSVSVFRLGYLSVLVCRSDRRLVLANLSVFPADQSVGAVWGRRAGVSAWWEWWAAAGAPWWVAG